MRVTTLDPMTLNDVHDLEHAPFVIDGEGENAIKIYFESEQNKEEFLAMEMHGTGSGDFSGLTEIFNSMAENPDTGSIN